ncbi:tetratricopeptide repeat protein [Streptomyces sp. SID8366]|uniref:tetratricopeptide repeat protein n=1 Tax=unclassified Streptomyces TaxID=2593676 RepID=UPI000DB9026C|nr:tetratricopeptide repeat protein [Streptomyces sp. PsTaAH-130]MYU05582.1 tetratricopeptide repeat protein [Streptomyces sp. SID8366]MYU63056.1 tetratricopeptide repeat protein [Streptomyces sp. SID69]RAJ63627.1 putative ATPase [Streptomyces sp. PsTaAH-130]
MVEQRGKMPDPSQATDLAEFVGLLGELRAWAGSPSYRTLAKRVGAAVRPARVVSPFTVTDVFKVGRRRLDLDLVVGIVRALGAEEPAVDLWRTACIKVHGLARTGGPVGVFGQLPTDLATFTGRQVELTRLIAAAAQDHDRAGANTVVISAVEGMAGVGKTQLAIHAAHILVRTGHFTDVQLYVNLRGFDPEFPPADPSAVLEAFLRQLGVAAQQIPESRDERAAMYRDRMRDRRAVVLLDNAATEDQVRDLIPAGPACLVLITSRRTLAGLDGATPHLIDTFTDTEALDLLTRIAGHDRVAAEPEAAARVIDYCDRLPLALALTAARLRSRPAWSLAELADRMRARRLEAISAGGRAIRPVFDASYQALPDKAQQVFRLIGLHPGPDFSAAATAALAGITADEVSEVLELLLDEHLLQQKRSGRYELHDLLRAYANEQADTIDPDQDRSAAVHRMLDHYVHTAHEAARLVERGRDSLDLPLPQPGVCLENFADHERALAWFATEQTVLLSAVGYATATGFDAHTWQLAHALATYLDRGGNWHDLAAVGNTAIDAADRLADPLGKAIAHAIVARARLRRGDYDDARHHLRHALELFGRIGDLAGRAGTYLELARVKAWQNPPAIAEGLTLARRARALYQSCGHKLGQAQTLTAIGWSHARLGDYAKALTCCRQALPVLEEFDDRERQAHAWDSIAYAHSHLGQHSQAVTCYKVALDLCRELGDRPLEADILSRFGDAHHAAHCPDAAHDAWQGALNILTQLDHPYANQIRGKLALHGDGPKISDKERVRGRYELDV